MTEITCTYTGDGETALVHGPTGTTLKTDLPPDNGGKGRCFSPTDLLAAARGDDFTGAHLSIQKIMAANPRRVGEFVLEITFPAHFTQEQKKFYLSAVNACPVHQTLSKDVKLTVRVL